MALNDDCHGGRVASVARAVRPKGALLDVIDSTLPKQAQRVCWWLILSLLRCIMLLSVFLDLTSCEPMMIIIWFVCSFYVVAFLWGRRPNCDHYFIVNLFSVCCNDGINRCGLKRAFDWRSYCQFWVFWPLLSFLGLSARFQAFWPFSKPIFDWIIWQKVNIRR